MRRTTPPLYPAGSWLGFTPLPPAFFLFLVFVMIGYLGLVEVIKRWFHRRYAR